MNYISGFIGWFLEHFTSEDVSMLQMILTLGLSCVIAVYIFFVYRMLGRKTIYSKRYNITLAGMVVIITAIIFTVQSSVLISFGMVGALSVIRFRTAIKDSLDIIFLFWAVTAGICCGAHMSEISIVLSAVLTILIFSLDAAEVKRGCSILVVEIWEQEKEKEVWEKIKEFSRYYKVKTKSLEEKGCKLVIELKVKQGYELLQSLKKISEIKAVSLIEQEGESNY